MKAVYYISNSRTWGHVATRVWDILEQEGFLREHTGIIFSGQEVMGYRDEKHEYFLSLWIRRYVWIILDFCRK